MKRIKFSKSMLAVLKMLGTKEIARTLEFLVIAAGSEPEQYFSLAYCAWHLGHRPPRVRLTMDSLVSRGLVEESEVVDYYNFPSKGKQTGYRLSRDGRILARAIADYHFTQRFGKPTRAQPPSRRARIRRIKRKP